MNPVTLILITALAQQPLEVPSATAQLHGYKDLASCQKILDLTLNGMKSIPSDVNVDRNMVLAHEDGWTILKTPALSKVLRYVVVAKGRCEG